ncbi:protein of unknown function [Paraburkholderia kururiensis]
MCSAGGYIEAMFTVAKFDNFASTGHRLLVTRIFGNTALMYLDGVRSHVRQ